MKKKIILLSLILVFLLSGCGLYNTVEFDNESNDGRMTLLYNDGICVIYQDNETGVQYFSRANSGSCVMVDSEGNPYTGGK